jgi:formaldehyde-activating enzyme involved in methanogenesis
MLKRLFQVSQEEKEGPGAEALGKNLMELNRAVRDAPGPDVSPGAAPSVVNGLGRLSTASVECPSFDQLYEAATVKPTRMTYNIVKVADMAASTHLQGLSEEAKRSAILMALEAASVLVEDLLQDAVVRQRALNEFEDSERQKLATFETQKSAENRTIQAELDQITAQYQARIQSNVEQVQRDQEKFRTWQKRKQVEFQRISEAAALSIPEDTPAGGNLAIVLERASRK